MGPRGSIIMGERVEQVGVIGGGHGSRGDVCIDCQLLMTDRGFRAQIWHSDVMVKVVAALLRSEAVAKLVVVVFLTAPPPLPPLSTPPPPLHSISSRPAVNASTQRAVEVLSTPPVPILYSSPLLSGAQSQDTTGTRERALAPIPGPCPQTDNAIP